MAVHHIIDDVCLESGGAQRIVRQLHGGLHEHGINSRLLTLCGPVDDVPSARSLGNSSPYTWHSFFFVLRYIHGHCGPGDIIHAHLFPTMLYVAIAVRILRWQGLVVCTEHSTSNRRRGRPIGKFIDSLIYPAYDRVYCISRGTKEALQAWMPSQTAKLHVVENGALLPSQQFEPRNAAEKIIIASVGRLYKLKNYRTALQAMALLTDVDFEYWIAGAGPEEESLKMLCTQLALDEKVKFYGYVADIFSFFRQADIFLIPSLWEGFGLAAVEAMNTGLPVIASNVAGLTEIIDTPNPCGLLVSPNGPEEIAHAVRSLLDSATRTEYGKNAFERSLAFSLERMIKQYADEYNRLLSHHFG